MSTNLRVLSYDIETAPMLAHIWRLKTDYVQPEAVIHDVFMLSWAAKWLDSKQVVSDVLTEHEAKSRDDSRIASSLADMLREADIVVAHNGDRFDLPMLNARVITLGLEPLGPIKTIDTLKLARKSFNLASNKLDYLARTLGLDPKHKTDFGLWKDCYAGDLRALKRMDRYCRQDVRTLEQVYLKLRPHVNGLPRLVDADYQGEQVCPHCGSTEFQKRGKRPHRTNAGTYQRYQCSDSSCLKWFRDRSADTTKKLSGVPL